MTIDMGNAVLLGAGYREMVERGEATLPPDAIEGVWAIGKMIMVSRDSLAEGYRRDDLPQWFPARICYPPEDVPGQWYRWYDPFIWFETEIVLHDEARLAPANMSYVGKLYHEKYRRDDAWAYPMDVWRERFQCSPS